MRITIEPTEKNQLGSKTVSICSDTDMLNIHTVVDDLIIPALVGFGFDRDVVEEAFSRYENPLRKKKKTNNY